MNRPGRRAWRPRDPAVTDRQANAADRDEQVYARKRARASKRRAAQERASFDPAPPDPDDWTIEDDAGAGLRRMAAPSAVGDAIETVLRRRGWTERIRSGAAWSNWEDIVGPELAPRCEPVRVAGGVLVVRAVSQVWATQLRYLLPQLQANAQQALGPGAVRSVRLVVGPLEGRTRPEVEPDRPTGPGA